MRKEKQIRLRPGKLPEGVSALSRNTRNLVTEMLVTGTSFEDTAGIANEQEDVGLTLRNVENFFRADLELQQKRIRRQLGMAQRLKKALRRPGTSQEAELAEAVLFAGLLALNRRGFKI